MIARNNRNQNLRKILIVIIGVIFVLTYVSQVRSISEENDEENYTDSDNGNSDNTSDDLYSETARLERIEERLSELEITVEEANTYLDEVREGLTLEAMHNMDISDKLDIIIVLLQQEKDNNAGFRDEVLIPFMESMELAANNSALSDQIAELNENTVSGNSVVSEAIDNSRKDAAQRFTEETERSRSELMILVSAIGIVIGGIFGVLVSQWFRKI